MVRNAEHDLYSVMGRASLKRRRAEPKKGTGGGVILSLQTPFDNN